LVDYSAALERSLGAVDVIHCDVDRRIGEHRQLVLT
jgi:hypothetical protein